MNLNWSALYLSAEPETEAEAWRWLGMILSMSPVGITEYEREKLDARAYDLFLRLPKPRA